jgi:GntR family transcriptional regulator/MocR family aminotransferase
MEALPNYMDIQNPILEQAALAEFLRTRKMDRHVRRMRRVYGDKRNTLLKALEMTFGDAVRPWGDVSGLHVALQFPGYEFGGEFALRCKNAGMRVSTLTQYCISGNEHKDKLLVGYGHLSAAQIQDGIHALRQLITG